ncbi:TPA: LacI family transcriptional regulator [bacterium]|nr:LacI family transcriptional regulator [bacterium]
MSKTITINDIANELGLSRNTVSKVLNGKKVPEQTKKIVMDKAIELGYKNLNLVSSNDSYLRNQKILLLTSKALFNLNFFLSIVRGIENTVKKYDFELIQYTFNFSTLTSYKDLSTYIKALHVNGIICIESFENEFIKELLSQEVPVVFIDFTSSITDFKGNFDIVMMENIDVVKQLCNLLIKQSNCKTFGFVGDYTHCKGFYERFIGMKEALFANNIEYQPSYSITFDDSFTYGDSKQMQKVLSEMLELPDCFICANDFIALSLMSALKALGKKIPEDIQVVGFDNIHESRISEPPLTTINTDKEYLGKQALNTLINRIKHPKDKNRIVYTETNIILRQSTKPIKLKSY